MSSALWICGAPGVGKSVTAWHLFTHSPDSIAFVDVDQLGMLYPSLPDDPEAYDLKRGAFEAVRPNYCSGHDTLVVSGIVHPAHLAADTNHVLLTVDHEVLRRRVVERGWTDEDADEAVGEQADLVDVGFADALVDTTGLGVGEVADRVRESLPPAPAPATARPGPPSPVPTGSLVFINGPRGVGCSTVGFGLARKRWGSDLPTAFLDLGQLSFGRSPQHDGYAERALGLANLTTLHRYFSEAGARSTIANGHLVDEAQLREVRRTAQDVMVVRLRADQATLRSHLEDRHGGSEARLTGDDMVGASREHRERVLALALEQQDRLDAIAVEDLVIDVSGRHSDTVVDELARLVE